MIRVMTEPVPLRLLIDAMATATASYPFKRWGFGESIAMEALLAAGGQHAAFARGLVMQWVRDHAPLASDPLAHVAPGVPLLALRGGDDDREDVLACALELANVLRSSEIGTHGAQIHRPDLPGWEHEVWVDCMHLDAPFLSQLANATGDDTWAQLAVEILLGHARVLQDDATGLFSHGFDDDAGAPNRVHWGRGQGWALLALVDTARNLPPGTPGRDEIVDRLQALVAGLARTEAGSGEWSTVVDVPATSIEASVPAFVALGVGRGLDSGLVDRQYRELFDHAWRTTRASIGDDGMLRGVSDATPVGADASHYDSRRTGVFPWGQGPALLAAIELNEREEKA